MPVNPDARVTAVAARMAGLLLVLPPEFVSPIAKTVAVFKKRGLEKKMIPM
jgi:hypothetical protein